MEKSNFMDKLRIFFGLRQDPPTNDFRNPIWSSDDEDDGDKLYTRQEMELMEDFQKEAIEMHHEFTRQMFDMLRSFGSMFGDAKTIMPEGPFDSLTVTPLPPENPDEENITGDNIRNYYLKPGYQKQSQEHLKEDISLDGTISPNDLSGLFKKKTEPPVVPAAPVAPFDGALVPGRSYCKTIITTSVTLPDGSVETRRIVKNGKNVVEETVTSTSTGTDTRILPPTPEK